MVRFSTYKLWVSSGRFVLNMGRRRKKHSGPGEKQERGRGYTDIVKDNQSFENYYKEQNIVPAEEWELFMSALRRNLPATFRITGFRGEAKQLLDFVKGHYIDSITTTTADGQTIQKPVPLSWYPNQAAWQLNYDRQILRKVEALGKLHQFLVSETDSGNISRQELVSMIPPLLLDVKSHHMVLDMCAAPGSKTAQLIEALHADESGAPSGLVLGALSFGEGVEDVCCSRSKTAQLIEALHADESRALSEGVVIGNDSDNKRCYIMVHQAKRLNSPNCMVVNHDARFFPKIFLDRPDGMKEQLMYDRILCDVPCSGDGTMRKNVMIWKQWAPTSALSLHKLQTQILNRGTELLNVGGKLVYSTCSFNPIENEAVIASVLKASEGSLQLADVGDLLPGLKRRSGLKTWKVINETPQEYDKLEDVPEKKRRRFIESMWPPTPEEAEQLNLHRCVRILPHDQDSGGFFVAVIEKTKRLPFEKEPIVKVIITAPTETAQTKDTDESAKMDTECIDSGNGTVISEVKDTDGSSTMDADGSELPTREMSAEASVGDGTQGEKETTGEGEAADKTDQEPTPNSAEKETSEPPKKKGRFGHKEDPFVYFTGEETVWPDIQKFYDVSSTFPVTQLLTRSYVGKKRNLYFTSRKIKSIIDANQAKLKIINSGIKMLIRSESDTVDCSFRLSQEGILSLYPYMGPARKVLVDHTDVINLLSSECPFESTFSRRMQEQLQNMGQGSMVFIRDPDMGDASETTCGSLIIVGWRGKMSVRSYLDRNSREHYLRMLGAEIPKSVPRPTVEALKIEASGDEARKAGEASAESEAERTETDVASGGKEKTGENQGGNQEGADIEAGTMEATKSEDK